MVAGFTLVSFFSGLAAPSESFGLTVGNTEGSSDILVTSKGTSGLTHFCEDVVSDGCAKKGIGRQDPLTTTGLKPELETFDAVSDNLVSDITVTVGSFPFSVVFRDTFVCVSQLLLLSTAGSISFVINSVSSFRSDLEFEMDLDSEGFVLD